MRHTTRIESDRDRALRQVLEEQRRAILSSVRATIREGRAEGAIDETEVQDEAEQSEADIQNELEFALLQMRGETLARIAEALDRLDAGQYGDCTECGHPIRAERLRALPFATRCLSCEQHREARSAGPAPVSTWRQAVELLSARD